MLLLCVIAQLEQRQKGVLFNGVDDDPLQLQPSHRQQVCHQVMAQGARRLLAVQPGQDVLGLGLIDPDRHLPAPGWIAQQHDGSAAGGIQRNAGHAHLHHGGRSCFDDYGQISPLRLRPCSLDWFRPSVTSSPCPRP